jgi:surface polysaccharide O-acyltransferase-like enzyme
MDVVSVGKRKKVSLIAIMCVLILFLTPNVEAIRTIAQDRDLPLNWTCSDNITLTVSVNSSKDGGDTYNTNCPFGCEENLHRYGADCVEPDYIVTLMVLVAIIAFFIFLLTVLGRRR